MKFILKKENWPHYANLMRLSKPIGTFLLLWPTLWALWIAAEGFPDWWVLVVFCLGVLLMRSAGCVINDYADRDFDAHVKRTRQRPLAQNYVTTREALTLFLVLVFAALLLVLTMNWLTIGLSVIALLLAATYPFMKRFTYYPQAVLGASFSWGIPMASGIFAMALSGHTSLPSIRTSMSAPTKFGSRVLPLSFGAMLLIYGGLGALGYAYYGKAAGPLITGDMSASSAIGKDPFLLIFLNAVQLGDHRLPLVKTSSATP